MRAPLLDPSGALGYHLRALRYRRSLWRPFQAAVGDWLARWNPPTRRLILIGPSAGYTLSADFFRRFERIELVEPDPLARWLLRRRFPDQRFIRLRLDPFAAGGMARLARVAEDSAVLFANVIGQAVAESRVPALRVALADEFAALHWASYHDVCATSVAPLRAAGAGGALGPATDSDALAEVLARFWDVAALDVRDFATLALSPGPAHYAVWSLTPRQHHLIEWLSREPGAAWSSGVAG